MHARHLGMARVRQEGSSQLSLSASIQCLRVTFPRLNSFPGGFQWAPADPRLHPWGLCAGLIVQERVHVRDRPVSTRRCLGAGEVR